MFIVACGAIAALTYTFTAALTDVPFSVGGLAKATFIGAASAAVTFGIGSACSTIGNFYIRATVQALSHGTFQGGMTAISGGKFWSGFAAGALSSIASSVWQGGPTSDKTYSIGNKSWTITGRTVEGLGGNFANSGAGMIAFGTVAGGAGSALTGGNFWQGAVTGLVVSGLNHAMHKMDGDVSGDPIKQPWDTNGDGILQKSEADNWWLNGNGKAISVDNRLIDWSGLEIKATTKFAIETHEAFIKLKYETAATYGGTSFKKTGLFSIEVQDQLYHYDYRANNSFKNVVRNLMTRIGEPLGQNSSTGALYTGKDFMIHYLNPSISVFDLR